MFKIGLKLLNYKLKKVIREIYDKIIFQSLSSRKVFFKINFLEKKLQKIFMNWSDLSISFQFQSFHRVYDRNWLNSKFCGGGPKVEPKPTSSGKNLLILWNTKLPIAAQLMSRHCIYLFQIREFSSKISTFVKFNY